MLTSIWRPQNAAPGGRCPPLPPTLVTPRPVWSLNIVAARGHAPAKIAPYVVILCFEKKRPKQKYCCSPKVKHFLARQKILGW